MSRSRRIAEMTSEDLSRIERPLLVIPVGSCEQHGAHLPLSTDTVIAETLCDELASRHPRVVIGPSITVSSSGEHAGFTGTLSIGREATSTTLVELVRSADWAHDVLFVNGHGGNLAALTHAASLLRSESRSVSVWSPHIDGSDAHAGHVETSLMLAIAPPLVHMDRARLGNVEPLAELATRLTTTGVRSVSPNGVLGDPRNATADEGHRFLSHLVSDLVTHAITHHP